jgi:o-succinylbenzoate synthase
MDATLFRNDVVLAQSVRASGQEHVERTRLYLRLEDDGVAGFGEVAPQPFSLNGDPSVDEVVDALRRALRQLRDVIERDGDWPRWNRVARLSAATPASNVAAALIEMAALDRELRRCSRTLEELWAPSGRTPRQVTYSLLDNGVEWVDDDVERVRLKTTPGQLNRRTIDHVATLKVPVLLDFNCSARSDNDVLHQVDQIGEVATISAVEQPYDVGNIVDHARLASRLDVPLSIDEGVRTLRDLSQIARHEAAGVVCVKPARVGGLANTRLLVAKANELGLRVYLGGFFESPFARRVNRTLANNCISEPSDLDDVALRNGAIEVEETSMSFGVEPSAGVLVGAEALSVV